MERRGAEVVAIDRWDNPRFREMHAALGSRAEYRQMNVYDLSPSRLGRFDVVLFLGVFYHLKHPLLALERVCSVTKSFAAFESFALTQRFLPGVQVEKYPLLQFFERDDFGGQFDNWFAATPKCLQGMSRTAGFARAELLAVHDFGAAIACYRNWDVRVGKAALPVPSPKLQAAVHAENFGINFGSAEDEYIQCQAESSAEWTPETVQAEVGPFGAAPASIAKSAQGLWLCTIKLPPGLDSGWHEVRLRTLESDWSNALRIAVDIPEQAAQIEITAACDGVDWTRGRFALSHRRLSLWIRGLPENADRANVKVHFSGAGPWPAAIDFAGAAVDGIRQINALADANLKPGTYQIQAEFAGVRSEPFRITADLR
jgi:hypothetical protein